MDRSGTPAYLVYYHKGEIKVKHGNVRNLGGVFFPDNEYIWHVGIPYAYYVVSSKGKMLVKDASDIPQARKAICKHYANKINGISDRAISSLNNIDKMIRTEKGVTQ